jgi:polyisoprenoid-binding protein YceI
MKKYISLLSLLVVITAAHAKVFSTKTGSVSFFSHTSIEDIKAENNEVTSFIDTDKGDFRFQLLVKGFIFPKAAMQQHFNGKEYMNSDEFPKAEFKGKITNLKDVKFATPGTYNATVEGDLTLHGVTKKITVPGTITVTATGVIAKSVFKIKRSDYGVTVPGFSSSKIAEELEITVNCQYAPFVK